MQTDSLINFAKNEVIAHVLCVRGLSSLETETAASTECWFGESEFNCKKNLLCILYLSLI